MRAIALLKPKVKVTAIVCAPKICPRAKRKSRETCRSPCPANRSKSSIQTPKPPHPGDGSAMPAVRLHPSRRRRNSHRSCSGRLGYVNAGIFASTDELYERFAKANQQAGEKMWRLPLDDEYKENLKSNIATW